MPESKKYATEYYQDPTRKGILLMCGFMAAIAILIPIIRMVDSKMLRLFFSFSIMPLLIVISVFFKKKFLKTAIIYFSDEEVTVNVYEHNSDILISKDKVLWSDIVSYKPYFDTKDNTCITLYLKNKKKHYYIFKDNKTYTQAINEESVLSNFMHFIRSYNEQHAEEKILPIGRFSKDHTN